MVIFNIFKHYAPIEDTALLMNKINVNKFIQPKNYINFLLRLINCVIFQKIDILFAPKYMASFKYPPVFFLGPPRSGSTLMYQVVTDAFDVAYLSNRHCQFFGAPAMAEWLFRSAKSKLSSDYASNHGKTTGWSAPSECGEWWYRFFRRDPAYVTLADVNEEKMHNFRRSLLALTEAASKPVVFKNLYASLRLEAISKHIPEALFVVVKRNELDNAHSILEGRMKALGRYEQWWSVPPPNVEQLKLLKPAQQAVEQTRAVQSMIRQAIEDGVIDGDRVLTLQYEDFCDDVHASVHELEKFFLKHDVTVLRRFNVPEKFFINRTIRIEKKLYSELKEVSKNT